MVFLRIVVVLCMNFLLLEKTVGGFDYNFGLWVLSLRLSFVRFYLGSQWVGRHATCLCGS